MASIYSGLESNENFYSFEYDKHKRIFKIGELSLKADDQLVQEPLGSHIVKLKMSGNNTGRANLDKDHVLIDFLERPLGLPVFHEWLTGLAQDPVRMESVSQDVAEVMIDADKQLGATHGIETRDGIWGYSFRVINQGRHANLHVFGDCACMGPDPQAGYGGESDWEEGLVGYGFHNTDTLSQSWSLLAGMGHLARLSSESSGDI